MFSIGDKVICIRDEELDPLKGGINYHILQKNKIYTIKDVYKTSIKIHEDSMGVPWNMNRFLTLKEYRKQKLNKIIC